jgi:hypothetical protein
MPVPKARIIGQMSRVVNSTHATAIPRPAAMQEPSPRCTGRGSGARARLTPRTKARFDGFVTASLAVRDGREPVFAVRPTPEPQVAEREDVALPG